MTDTLKLFWNRINILSDDKLESFLSTKLDHNGQLDLIVIDLSVGVLEGHTVAKECCRQLDLSFELISVDCGKGISAQDIDLQAYGDIGRLIAYKNAKNIARKLNENPSLSVLITIPASECQWEEEDIWLINEISYLLDFKSDWLIFAVTTSSIAMPNNYPINWDKTLHEKTMLHDEDHILSYFPGLILNNISEISNEVSKLKDKKTWWQLKDGRHFISTGRQYSPENLTLTFSDETIQEISTTNPWFKFYLSPKSEKTPCSPKLCRYLSEIAFSQGTESHALRIAEWITKKDWSETERSRYQLVLMYIYLHSDQYRLLSELKVDTQRLTKKEQKILWQRKGYAYVFLEKPSDALYCFDCSERIEITDPAFSSLFKKNIKSLALMKNNDKKTAMKLQKELEKDVENIDQDCFHFASINTLNIGRLYLRMDLPKNALPYILKFKEMNQGAYSDSYLNIQHHYLSVIYELIGQPEKALWELIKLALVWLSSNALGDLSKRRCKIISKSINGSDYDVIESISEKIIDNLERVSKQCGQETISLKSKTFPNFIRTQNHLSNEIKRQEHCIIHTNNLSVLGANYTSKKRMQGGVNFRELHKIVWQRIQPSRHFSNTENIKTVLVSMNQGYTISSNLNLVLGELPFFNINKLYHEQGCIEFENKTKIKCEHNLWIKLNDRIDKAIDHQDGVELRFKRFWPIEYITGPDADLIRKLTKNKKGLQLSKLGISKQKLQDLHSKNWIHIFTDDSIILDTLSKQSA